MSKKSNDRSPLEFPTIARRSLRPSYDAERFGEIAERFARFIGTARFLVYMTVIVLVWVIWNLIMPSSLRFDEYPFIFLTLILSLQASYAAPLILLAQNRQEDRDREQLERDREMAARTQADTEYLARELAGVRLALADVVTTEDLRDQLERINEALDELIQRSHGTEPTQQPDA